MWSKVSRYVKKNNLLDSSGLYLVALSGGADSVALLLLLHEAGFRIEAVHCNFHLRGAESDRDEKFCEALCASLNVPFHRVHFDTFSYAEAHKVSIELAARELRYGYFEQLRRDLGAAGICVAHHRDDLVETVLMNLVRGTGLRGLVGIQPRRGYILRPLLGVSRSEIEEFLRERGQAYVTDSTNLTDDATRNRVRHHLLPLLCELNPAAVENIQRMAEHAAEVLCVLDKSLLEYRDSKSLSFSELDNFGSRGYLLYEWLKNYGFNGAQVEQLLASMETGRIFSSATHDVLVDRDRLLVEPHAIPMKPLIMPEPGTYVADDRLRIVIDEQPVTADFQPSKKPDSITLDADRVHFPLTLRPVATGDAMVPFGMTGRKLVSDVMTDCKINLFEKRRQLVVADADGQIVWLVGLRTDNRYRVGKTTTRVLTLAVTASSGLSVGRATAPPEKF